MKNLKRVLSLGLASVMLLGMMVVGASAKDFTDADKIVNSEAVQILVALKIVNGKEDGSYFDPEGTVTRGEMAKMIAVAMNGGNEANTGVKGTPSFTDIGGHWAEGWIEYCVDMGIIGGRGDGTFDPNGLVTGTEALKMVLTAMGYDATAYHLQGAGWAAQTLENARKTQPVNLIEGLDNIVMTQPATRDTAAQMIWNGLQSYVVDITPDKNTNTGETSWQYKTQTGVTLLNQRYKADVKTAVFTGNAKYHVAGAPAEDEIAVQNVTYSTDKDGKVTKSVQNWAFPAEIDIDKISEEVKVVWKDGAKSTNKNAPDRNDDIYGVFLTGATHVERTTKGNVKDHKTGKAQINLDGNVYDVAKEVEVVTNYATSAFYTAGAAPTEEDGTAAAGSTTNGWAPGTNNARDKGSNSNLTDALKAKTGDTIKAVFDDNGKIYRIYILETKIASVSSVTSVNINMNESCGSAKIADHDVEEGLKKGDVVTVTTWYGNKPADTDAESVIRKAEKVSGEVERYELDDMDTDSTPNVVNITLSGKKYNTYKGQNMIDVLETDKDIQVWNKDTANKQIGKDFDLYLVNGYAGAAVQTSADASNYSVITEIKVNSQADTTFAALQLQVMGADGTKEIINVSKDSTKTSRDATSDHVGVVDATDYRVGDIITYSFDKNDMADVTLEEKNGNGGKVTASPAGAGYSDTTKILKLDGSTDGVATASDCVIFVQTNDKCTVPTNGYAATNADWAAYNIRDLGDIKLTTGSAMSYVLNADGNRALAVFMDLGVIPDGAADDTVYGIITSANARVADYYDYTVQSNGESYSVRSKNNNLEKGMLVRFKPTADGTYSTNAIKVYKKAGTSTGKENIDNNILEIAATNIGFVDEFSTSDRTLTYLYGGNVKQADPSDPKSPYTDETGLTQKTYALAKDAAIVYLNVNSGKSESEASVDHYSEYTGYRNVAFVTKMVGSDEVISVMFVESDGNAHVDKNL